MDLPDSEGWTALHWAVARGRTEIVSALVNERSANVNAKTFRGYMTPLDVATCGVEWMLRRGNRSLPVNDKIRRRRWDMAAMLLLQLNHTDVNDRNAWGWNPLLCSIRFGRTTIVEILLSSPTTNLNVRTWKKQSPLFLAASYGRVEIMELLLAG